MYHIYFNTANSRITGKSYINYNHKQGWHGTFYQLGKTGWVKLDKKISFTFGKTGENLYIPKF